MPPNPEKGNQASRDGVNLSDVSTQVDDVYNWNSGYSQGVLDAYQPITKDRLVLRTQTITQVAQFNILKKVKERSTER